MYSQTQYSCPPIPYKCAHTHTRTYLYTYVCTYKCICVDFFYKMFLFIFYSGYCQYAVHLMSSSPFCGQLLSLFCCWLVVQVQHENAVSFRPRNNKLKVIECLKPSKVFLFFLLFRFFNIWWRFWWEWFSSQKHHWWWILMRIHVDFGLSISYK